MEADSIGTGVLDVTVQFSIVPYGTKKGVKFSLRETVLQKALACLEECRSQLAQLLEFAGRLGEIELSLEDSEESDSDAVDDDDLNLLSKININLAPRSTEGLRQLGEFLHPEQGMHQWINENLVPNVKGFKYFSVLLDEKYFKVVMKKTRSIEKQLKDTGSAATKVSAAASGSAAADTADASTKPKALTKMLDQERMSGGSVSIGATADVADLKHVESAAAEARKLTTDPKDYAKVKSDVEVEAVESESADTVVKPDATDIFVESEAVEIGKFESEAAEKVVESEAAEKVVESEAAEKVVESEAAEKVVESEAAEKVVESEAAEKVVESEAAEKVVESESAEKFVESKAAEKVTESEAASKGDSKTGTADSGSGNARQTNKLGHIESEAAAQDVPGVQSSASVPGKRPAESAQSEAKAAPAQQQSLETGAMDKPAGQPGKPKRGGDPEAAKTAAASGGTSEHQTRSKTAKQASGAADNSSQTSSAGVSEGACASDRHKNESPSVADTAAAASAESKDPDPDAGQSSGADNDNQNLSSWMEGSEYMKLSEENKSKYVAIEFRLFIADIVKYIVDQVLTAKKLPQDDKFFDILTHSVLNAKCDVEMYLMLTNTDLNKSCSFQHKITTIKKFYTLPSWRLFFRIDKLKHFVYAYKLTKGDQNLNLLQVKELQGCVKQFGPYVSSPIERVLSSITLSEAIAKSNAKRKRPPDGVLTEIGTRSLSPDRRICLDAFLEPFIDSAIGSGKSSLFWRIFASHAAALIMSDSAPLLSSDPVEFLDQCYISLINKWLKIVAENEKAKILETKASEVNYVFKRLLSSPFNEFFTLKPGGGILLCRVSLLIQRRFAPENKAFWKTDEATMLLSFLQKPALKGISSQAIRFLDTSLSPFLCLCFCAKVLHPSASPDKFIKLIKVIGFVERGQETFRADFVDNLVKSGLLRSLSPINFVSAVAAIFNSSDDFDSLKLLFEEFMQITSSESAEIFNAFESSDFVSSDLKEWIRSFGSVLMYKKHLADLKSKDWQRFCDILPKVKRLQCVEKSVWHGEVVPVVRDAIIASVKSKYENDNSPPNRQALAELLDTDGILDSQFAVHFLTLIFSSKSQWLIKFCLDKFATLFLDKIKDSESEQQEQIVCQFVNQSVDFFNESVCSVIKPLIESADNQLFKNVCRESAFLALKKKNLTRPIIEKNVEAAKSAEILDIVFDACLEKITSSETDEKAKEEILKTFQHPYDAFSMKAPSRSLFELFGLSLENFLCSQFSQRPATVFSVLPQLLEKNFMWKWMSCDHNEDKPLAGVVRQKIVKYVQCIQDFAMIFFAEQTEIKLNLNDFSKFCEIFSSLKDADKLACDTLNSSLYDYFDMLLNCCLQFAANRSTAQEVEFLNGIVQNWEEQSAVVDQIFDFLYLISGSNSQLNIKLLDFDEKHRCFQSLKQQFTESIRAADSGDLVFQLFEIRNVRDLELMKSLVRSDLFRKVFVRFNPSSGGSGSLFSTVEVDRSDLANRPQALISVQCSYVLDKMLPEACNAYKEFWTAVETGTLPIEKVESFVSDDKPLNLNLEKEIVATLQIQHGVVDKLQRVQQRQEWCHRVEILQFFMTEFYKADNQDDQSQENIYISCDENESEDENTKPVTSFCNEALKNHEDATALFEEFLNQCEGSVPLRDYLEVFDDIVGAFGNVDPNVWEVLKCLFDCRKETLPFLREQLSSDFQQLLDNTDETVAQDLSLSVINSLVSLQQALKDFLSLSSKSSVILVEQSVLQAIRYFEAADSDPNKTKPNIPNEIDQRQKAAKNLIDRIKECNGHINSIKALHASMGSRGETSKILAVGIVNEKSDIRLTLKTDLYKCSCILTRAVNGSKNNYSLSQLRDHRSRIIITLSSHTENVDHDEPFVLKQFVALVDLLENAYETAERLLSKGHPLFANKTIDGLLSDAEFEYKKLQKEEELWDEVLADLREKYNLANYVFGSNLIKLFQVFCLQQLEMREVRDLLYFMKIDLSNFQKLSIKKVSVDALEVNSLSQRLHEIFAILTELPKLEPRQFEVLPLQKTDLCVKQGELLVCQLSPNEKDVISIFLNVWISSQKSVPWNSEIVFCSQDTASDEVILALRRSSREPNQVTFLVEVQNLRQKVLREAIAELIRQNSQKVLGKVAILCRAPESHSVFTVFRDNVVKAKALTEEKLKIVLRECFSNIYFCTSDRPSVGKSEGIITSACSKSNRFCRIHISGLVQKYSVMEKIRSANVTTQDVVHIDVGSVQNPDLLELVLFEAVFCETLTTAHAIVRFKPKTLYLEIANSIDKELEDSFTLFSCLSESKCDWKNLKNLEISEEPTSPIQIVCKYLYFLATNKIDNEEISLTDFVPKDVCLNLLGQFFSHPLDDGKRPCDIMSFLVLESCLKILGEQLKKFTASTFFKVRNLQLVYGNNKTEVRAKMVGLIMQSTLRLTLRSVSSIKYQQSESRKNVYDHTLKRFRGLINWEDSSYVLPVFMNQDISTVELIYRKLTDVTADISDLFSGASSKELKEFSLLSQNELFEKLVKIAARGRIGYKPQLNKDLVENYTLTADNFLKMILITLRVDADVPVIIIGETGCGKTSLIRYLAAVQECKLVVMNFHAGISEASIIERVSQAATMASSLLKEFVESQERVGVVWMFLDEINTCDHLGMLKEIVCHRRFLDRQLPCNLRFIAACNPYVLRPRCSNSIQAGLEIKELKDDKMTNLVYRVHPLPETMVELVWDFGRLTDSDEQAYISQMVSLSIPQRILRDSISECLSKTQKFIRYLEKSEYATSLRDIRRFCEFYCFFRNYFEKKFALTDSMERGNPSKKAFLFALYICYYVRISSLEDRHSFANMISSFFETTADEIQKSFMLEELDVLKRMRVPRKTARNLALRENVFILFCCIYCQIPALLVGKPGCSKSLAVNLIKSNLRGKDSTDPLFRQFPSLRFFSYQGSEASTSEGIRRIFAKAENSIESCTTEDSKAVVLIDEIGLAEKSRYNPLKVLHSLLEPESSLDCKSRVSVVGISNWALDPAKMNRAIHISRPEMNEQELRDTGKAICSSEGASKQDNLIPDEILGSIAAACHRYFKNQPFDNFHGLRDFYYLLKFICDRKVNDENKLAVVKEGLLRNFNGDKSSFKEVIKQFENEFSGLKSVELDTHTQTEESVTESLINRNLQDPQARHIM